MEKIFLKTTNGDFIDINEILLVEKSKYSVEPFIRSVIVNKNGKYFLRDNREPSVIMELISKVTNVTFI